MLERVGGNFEQPFVHVTYHLVVTTSQRGRKPSRVAVGVPVFVVPLLAYNLPSECVQAEPEIEDSWRFTPPPNFDGFRRSVRRAACTHRQGETASSYSRTLRANSSLTVHFFPYDSSVSSSFSPSRTTPSPEPRQETSHRLFCYTHRMHCCNGLNSALRP